MAFFDHLVWTADGTDLVIWKMLCLQYALYAFCGLLLLRRFSIAGRPVAHEDRQMGRKHKEVEAEQVEILEGLRIGSNLADYRLLQSGDDVVVLKARRLSDVEEPFLRDSGKGAAPKVATVSLSAIGGFRLPSQAYDWMKQISEGAGRGKGAKNDSFVCSLEKAVMQSEVELHDGLLESLKDVFKLRCFSSVKEEGVVDSKPSRVLTPIVQIGSWAVLKPFAGGVDLLRLPVDEFPVVLHAEYAAGLLTITGLNLEDADLYISAESAHYTVKLNVWRFLKGTKSRWGRLSPPAWQTFSDTVEDIVTVPFRLTWTDVKAVFVYASKKVELGGDRESVEAMSKAVRVVDSFWKTVVRLWLPTVMLWVLSFYSFRELFMNQYFRGLTTVISTPFDDLPGVYFHIMLCFSVVVHKAGTRIVEFFQFHVETLAGGLGQAMMVFYYGFRNLKGPKIVITKAERRNCPQL